VTLNLKIEILKVFSLEFNISSDKELKLKKEKPDENAAPTEPASGKSASSSK
jgi:hypothetical protein